MSIGGKKEVTTKESSKTPKTILSHKFRPSFYIYAYEHLLHIHTHVNTFNLNLSQTHVSTPTKRLMFHYYSSSKRHCKHSPGSFLMPLLPSCVTNSSRCLNSYIMAKVTLPGSWCPGLSQRQKESSIIGRAQLGNLHDNKE